MTTNNNTTTPTEYTSKDGLTVTASGWTAQYIASLKARGYTEEIKCTGVFVGSELEVCCRLVGIRPIVAFTRPNACYAYVITETGRIVDGCFHQFADGSISLS